jgi:hypothetical protein
MFKNVQPCSFIAVLAYLRDSAKEVRLKPVPEFVPEIEWEIMACFDDKGDAQDAREHIDKMLALTQ